MVAGRSSRLRVSLPPRSADTANVRVPLSSLSVGVLLLSAGCAGRAAPRPLPPMPPPVETVRVQFDDRGQTVIRDVPLESYVAATALSEFAPAAGNPAAVESMYAVQAIVARTYAIAHRGRHARDGFDLCATSHCQ